MTLDTVPVGSTVTIDKILFDEQFCRRCQALGLRCGNQATVIRRAPMGGPLQIRIGTTDLFLRGDLAKQVEVL